MAIAAAEAAKIIEIVPGKKPLAAQERNMYSVAHKWAQDLEGLFLEL